MRERDLQSRHTGSLGIKMKNRHTLVRIPNNQLFYKLQYKASSEKQVQNVRVQLKGRVVVERKGKERRGEERREMAVVIYLAGR
jgi:hypothetical protein